MSIPQIGYPITSTGVSMSQASLTSGSSPKSSRGSPCCENGRPVMTNPLNGQTICSCQYNPAAAAALYSYPRVPGLPEALYSSAMAAHAQGMLPLAAADPSALYGGLAPGYDFKGLSATPGLYPFDPSLAAYPYGNGFLDPNSRRKNATRESTATLKAWLSEHKKNPYPTKGEKIMLAIITKMTLTQVSTWFANARRRLKKDHKMTWEPRNRMDDDDEHDIGSDEENDNDKDDNIGEDENISVDSDDDDTIHPLRLLPTEVTSTCVSSMPGERSQINTRRDQTNENEISNSSRPETVTSDKEVKVSPKPKIWSMAEIATSSKSDNSSNTDSINIAPQISHQNKLPSAHAQALHPAWRTAHPYFQAQMLQSHLAVFSHPAHRLPTNPFPSAVMRSPLRQDARVSSAFVPISNLSKSS